MGTLNRWNQAQEITRESKGFDADVLLEFVRGKNEERRCHGSIDGMDLGKAKARYIVAAASKEEAAAKKEWDLARLRELERMSKEKELVDLESVLLGLRELSSRIVQRAEVFKDGLSRDIRGKIGEDFDTMFEEFQRFADEMEFLLASDETEFD